MGGTDEPSAPSGRMDDPGDPDGDGTATGRRDGPPPLEEELERARSLDVAALADAVERIGFECTRCGACCRAAGDDGDGDDDPHTATVFPDEIRRLQEADDSEADDWRDVARPMPYGLEDGVGETFEWALQTDDCGDCTFYREEDGTGACTVHADRPLVCRTYPFSVALAGTDQPVSGVVDREGPVRAHECEALAAALKRRAVGDLKEAIAVREGYEPTSADGIVVHDSEGAKRPDGTPYR